jgi:hypothetical protein
MWLRSAAVDGQPSFSALPAAQQDQASRPVIDCTCGCGSYIYAANLRMPRQAEHLHACRQMQQASVLLSMCISARIVLLARCDCWNSTWQGTAASAQSGAADCCIVLQAVA